MRLRLKRGFGQTLACAETERKARPFTTACRLCEAATDKQLFLVPFGTPAEASGVWRRCINSLEGLASATSVPSRVELTASGLALLGSYVCTWHARIAITCTTSRYFFCVCVCLYVFHATSTWSITSSLSRHSSFQASTPLSTGSNTAMSACVYLPRFFLFFFFVLDIISVDVSGCIRGHRLASLLRALVCWQLSEPALSFSRDVDVFVSEGSSFIFLV